MLWPQSGAGNQPSEGRALPTQTKMSASLTSSVSFPHQPLLFVLDGRERPQLDRVQPSSDHNPELDVLTVSKCQPPGVGEVKGQLSAAPSLMGVSLS